MLPLCVPVIESSQVSEARRNAVNMARAQGFDETRAGQVALLATEASTNMLKHGSGGELLLRGIFGVPDRRGIEMLALDSGPGMADLAACMSDGYSTAGSPGTGLGAMSRIADLLDIYTQPGKGTAVLIRVWAQPAHGGVPAPAAPQATQVGAVCMPKPGQQVSGDGWAVHQTPDGGRLMVVDGLGHGADAAAASSAAIEVFCALPRAPLPNLIEDMHAVLHNTRGAALALAELSLSQQQVRYAGVGNVSGMVWTTDDVRHMVSHNGTVGHVLHRVQEFVYPWAEGAQLVLFTDGLASQAGPNAYPGITLRHPSLLAGVLYRDFKRGRDDATVVVMRGWQASQPV
jgi:anti-sigma regulatory factor (Ser/Thr protein kinase)